MTENEIRSRLSEAADPQYREFQSKLIPTINKDTVIGVRTPMLKSLAKELIKQNEADEFLSCLPHKFYDENMLHAYIISEVKDYKLCVSLIEKFLPYIDNWAVCDSLKPKVFSKHTGELEGMIWEWIKSDKTYTVRFALSMLMSHFLGDNFDLRYPQAAAAVRSEDYYVRMMVAWYFATALAKQYSAVLPFIEDKRLDVWTHNKAIQKAVESRRITNEQKLYLRQLKINTNLQ